MSSSFAKTLALLRKEKGVSQKEVASQMGISQALLSHYEKGVREPGLDFVSQICDYYHVSADYLLGRTLAKDGAMIPPEEVHDSSQDKSNVLKGSVIATLQKKLVVNATSVLFDLLGKMGNRDAINAASNCISGEIYKLFRHLHRESGEDERYFSLSDGAFQMGAVSIVGKKSEIEYVQALQNSKKEEVEFPPMDAESISDNYPGLSQSMTQVLHNIDTKIVEEVEK